MTTFRFTDPRNYPDDPKGDRNKNTMDLVAQDMADYWAKIDGTDRGKDELLEFLLSPDRKAERRTTISSPLTRSTGKPLIYFSPSKPKGESSKFPER
jgi:hypothetical protein